MSIADPRLAAFIVADRSIRFGTDMADVWVDGVVIRSVMIVVVTALIFIFICGGGSRWYSRVPVSGSY